MSDVSSRNRNNRRKGHDFERYIAVRLRDIDGTARRNLEYQSGSYDIETQLRFTIQCKNTTKWTPPPSESLKQASDHKIRGTFPLALHKLKGGDTYACLYLEDFLSIINHFAKLDRYLWRDCPEYYIDDEKI